MEKYFGEWIPYSGNSAVILGVVLFVIAVGFTLSGFKLKESLRVKIPGEAVTGMLVAVWLLSILTFLVNVVVYSLLLDQAKFSGAVPANPITKFTLSFAFISFLVVFFLNRSQGKKVAFFSAVFATMAGPMVFELPFDLIVMGRTYPPIPPDPTVLRLLFFLPLFIVELTTISLLFFSPLFKVTKYTLYSLGGMFFVFAIWGFLSFSFAYTTEFLLLNVVAKALAFVTVVTLFLPQKTMVSAELSVGLPENLTWTKNEASNPNTIAIKVSHLEKTYGNVKAVEDVSFEVKGRRISVITRLRSFGAKKVSQDDTFRYFCGCTQNHTYIC